MSRVKLVLMKSRRMISTGYVARMGISRLMHIGFLWESQKERDHQKDLDAGERIILK
jgi:hypothetical protein